jgi:hypothetical protein
MGEADTEHGLKEMEGWISDEDIPAAIQILSGPDFCVTS